MRGISKCEMQYKSLLKRQPFYYKKGQYRIQILKIRSIQVNHTFVSYVYSLKFTFYENRLDRLWRHKQKEKELKMSRIRRIHDKEIKALERKCQIKNDKLRVDLMGGKFKMLENAKQLRQTTSASGPLGTDQQGYGVNTRRPVWFEEAPISG